MIETNLLHYGYLFIVAGVIFEGDATLLTAAFLAHRGYFHLSLVLIVAAMATIVSTHLYYEIAKHSGMKWLEHRKDERIQKVIGWSQAHGILLVVGSRFMIGTRSLVPIVCGGTGMSRFQFALGNIAGASLWAGAFGLTGYAGNHLLALLVENVRAWETPIAAVIAIAVGTTIIWRTRGHEIRDAWSLWRAKRFPIGPAS